MRTVYFSFLFLLFFASIFSVSVLGIVNVIRDIPDVNLTLSSCTAIYMITYFEKFNTINIDVSWNNFTSAYNITRSFNQSQYCRADIFDICLIPSANEIIFEITTTGKTGCSWMQITAWNSSDAGNLVVQGFQMCAISDINSNISSLSDASSILSIFTGIFMNLFPNSENLSYSQKFGFVFVTMAIITTIIYVLSFVYTKKILSYVHFSVMLINMALFLFFVAIGFIPIILLIVLGCLVILLSYFRIKGGK